MTFWSKTRAAAKRLFGVSTRDESACDHRHTPHQPGTPEFELFVARGELRSGNLQHGAQHLAALISFDPLNREWLDLLHQYLSRVGNDGAKLYPSKDKRNFAEEAVRAYILARNGKVTEAVELLVEVVEAKPDSAYLEDWAMGWLKTDETFAAIPQLTRERILALGLNRYPEFRWLRTEGRDKLECYVQLAARVTGLARSSARFQMLHAGLLRKVGRFDEALVVARDPSLPKSWHSLVAEGLALRERGDVEEAAAAFEQALTFDPEELSARLEAGDGYLNHREWDKAHHWYAQVLQRQPDHPWALPSALLCQWKSSGNEFKHKRLRELAFRIPPNQRAEQLLRLTEPYVGILPAPADATANMVRSITKSFQEKPPEEPGGDIAITVSHLESPSATLALEEQLKALGHPMPVIVTVKSIPQPDPRRPCRPIRHELWKYEGTRAKPAVGAPPRAIWEIISELSSRPYELDENFLEAKRTAGALNESHIPDLLAVMVHPPPIPAGKDALEWLPRVQLSAAQVIAHLGSGWQDSARRDALLAALFGPRDWVTVAAIVTLAHLAEENSEIEADVAEAFQTLSGFIPDDYCCFAGALFACWQWLPGLSQEEKRSLYSRWLAREGG